MSGHGTGTIPTTQVQGLVRMLVVRYGSVSEAGRAYDQRFGYKGGYARGHKGGEVWRGTGTRLFTRILSGRVQTVSDWTYDQIETLEAS